MRRGRSCGQSPRCTCRTRWGGGRRGGSPNAPGVCRGCALFRCPLVGPTVARSLAIPLFLSALLVVPLRPAAHHAHDAPPSLIGRGGGEKGSDAASRCCVPRVGVVGENFQESPVIGRGEGSAGGGRAAGSGWYTVRRQRPKKNRQRRGGGRIVRPNRRQGHDRADACARPIVGTDATEHLRTPSSADNKDTVGCWTVPTPPSTSPPPPSPTPL